MSDKLLKILVLTMVTIGLVVFGIFLVRNKNQKDAALLLTNIENPFGLPPEDVSLPETNNQNNLSNQNLENQQPALDPQAIPDFVIVQDSPILKKISNQPVSGATFVEIQREVFVPKEVSENLVELYDFTNYPTLRFGDDKKEVQNVKIVLNRQNPSPELPIDEAFDTNLKNAVVSFQTKNGLPPDGVLAKSTYQKLNDFQGIKPATQKGSEKEIVEFARFVDKSTGYIFDRTTKLNEPEKIVSNTNIPMTQESFFDDKKNSVFVRYLQDGIIKNLIGVIKKGDDGLSGVVSGLDTIMLPDNITFVSFLPNNKKVFYLLKTSKGVDGFSYDFLNKKTTKIWSSSFSEWIPQWFGENTISLTTKASGLFPGNSYILDVKNNSLKNIIRNVNGLTTNMSPDGKKIIYSSYENNQLKTLILNIANGQISDFSPTTLPEKCIWTKDSKKVFCGGPTSAASGLYPDDWYKGIRLFSDVLWVYDTEQNTSKILLDSRQINTQIDITSPQLNDKADYLIFINKHDLSLYGIDLSRLE